MPWKLILFLICLVVTAFFIGFNLDNACNINLGFKTYENVPVFLTVLVSFVAGAFISFIFMLGVKLTKTDKKTKLQKEQKPQKLDVKKDITKKTTQSDILTTETVTKPKKTSLIEKSKKLLPKKKKEEKIDDGEKTVVLDKSK